MKTVASEAWASGIDELGIELIDLPEYAPNSDRVIGLIARSGKCPDWLYWHEVLFIKQLKW